MHISNLKLIVDLEIHPDQISVETFTYLEALPHFDEIDTYSDTTFVMFWLETPDQIESALASLRDTLGVLL